MVDRLNTRMINLANQTPRIAFVDMRGTVGDGRWFDELHPTDEGYGLVTRKIVAKVAELTAGSRDGARRRAATPPPPACGRGGAPSARPSRRRPPPAATRCTSA